MLDTRLALAELFHAPDPSCIVFAANATMALNTVLNGVLHPGDHVITTVCEHNSVLRPLYRLRAQGVEVSFTGVDAAAQLCYDQWETLLRPTTLALVVTGASNVTGNGTDLARAADFAHRHGLLLIVDAAQTAVRSPLMYSSWALMLSALPGTKLCWDRRAPAELMCAPGYKLRRSLWAAAACIALMKRTPCRCPPHWRRAH